MEAGLSFAWRVPGGSFGRTVFGVLVATGLFAGAASVLHVHVPFSALPTREAAQVIALGEDDAASRDLLDWARFHSPFPDRWDPPGTGLLEHRMDGVQAALEASCAYQSRLLPRFEQPRAHALPGLIEVERFPLPPIEVEPSILLKGIVAAKVDAVSVAKGPLQERWGTERIVWGGENRASLIGVEATFTVGVTPDGRVAFCLVLNGAGAEVDKALEAWLRKKRLPESLDTDGMELDVVSVRFEAAPEDNPDEPSS